MAKIKQSQLKGLFTKVGLSEGIFDLFNKKRKALDKKVTDIKQDIEDTIKSAPNDKEKQRLRDLHNAIQRARKLGVKIY